MWRNLGSNTNRNSTGTIDQQIGDPCRENTRLDLQITKEA
jgi:hypothetical protein